MNNLRVEIAQKREAHNESLVMKHSHERKRSDKAQRRFHLQRALECAREIEGRVLKALAEDSDESEE